MLKNLIKFFNNKEEKIEKEDVVVESEPVSVERTNVYQTQVGDFLQFGANDLVELEGQFFDISERWVFKKENGQLSDYLVANGANGKQVIIDTFSETQHIYVMHEIDFENCLEKLIEEDEDSNFLSHLNTNVEDSKQFTFNKSEEVDHSVHWLEVEQKYYIQDDSVCEFYKVTNNEPISGKGLEHKYYVFQTADREYRVMIMFDRNGVTRFYAGRRIEPINIDKVIGKQ